MLSFHGQDSALGRSVFAALQSVRRSCARLFQPMYAPRHAGAGWANIGHPSREEGFSLRSRHRDARNSAKVAPNLVSQSPFAAVA